MGFDFNVYRILAKYARHDGVRIASGQLLQCEPAQRNDAFTEIREAARTIRRYPILIQSAGYLGGDTLESFFTLPQILLGSVACSAIPDDTEDQFFTLVFGPVITQFYINNCAVLATLLSVKMGV